MKTIAHLLAVALFATRLFLAAQPALASERVTYKRNSDRDLMMTITKPPGWTSSDRRSAIIFFFNGGWKEPGAPRPQFEEQARYFAARGMVVAQADYREKSGGGVTSDKCVEDIFSAVRWLRSHAGELGLDPARIAAAGGSGSIHLPAAVFRVDDIRAPGEDASINPLPGALFSFHPDPDVLDVAMMNRLLAGGALAPGRRMPPTVVYWGSRDAVAPFLAEFVGKTRTAGLPVESYVGEGGVHGFYKFTPGLEKTTEHMDQKLRVLGFLSDEPRAELPHKAAPPDYEQRILATQQQWLERHKQLEKERNAAPEMNQATSLLPKKSEPNPPPPGHIYKTLGERKLQLAVHYPAGWKREDKRPALLCFEGGGENPKDKEGNPYPLAAERAQLRLPVVNAGPGGGFVPVAEHFAKLGLVCIRVEYRKRKTDGVLPDQAVEDAKSAIRWVRAHAVELGVDPARVVATGASSGGHLAASLAALKNFDAATDDLSISCRPDALILHSPLLDFLEGGTRNTTFLSALENDRVLGERLSPARHWSKEMPPTLLFTGEKESVHEMLCDFAKKWKTAGQPIELVTGAGGHVYSLNEKWIAETLPRMETFLKSIGCLDSAAASGPPAGGATRPANRDAAALKQKLDTMLRNSPEADVNKDGVLTMEEAKAFKQKAKKSK